MIGAIIVIVGLATAVGMFIEVRQTHKKKLHMFRRILCVVSLRLLRLLT